MYAAPSFQTESPLAQAMRKLFLKLEERLALTEQVRVYLAGGMAVHLYTAIRATTDVDAEFGKRLILPNDLTVEVVLDEGARRVLYLDTNYNPAFSLLHEDYQQDATPVDFGLRWLDLRVLTPTDLAVSKLMRFEQNDRVDIRSLASAGLISAGGVEQRATEAMAGYFGDQSGLKHNLREALALINQAHPA